MNKQIIHAVIAAMNRLEVRGEENLNILLGCIQTMNGMIGETESEENKSNDSKQDSSKTGG